MKGGHNKKSVRVEFVMSEPEAELVKERMAELGITNLSAYLRKMAVDGYIIHLDMGDIQEMIRLLRICSNNLNQYTRRANETGNIYAADIDDIRTRLDSLWDAHFFLGMSKTDIARAEGTDASSVRKSINRGLHQLKKYFEKI